ncbi:MAG: HAMP domain-containing histidine kinase [Treponema sp.]|jgi:signal transduction histidine kinase|nr:HAMP domain-containing histidine kinase [Treponema sp.]
MKFKTKLAALYSVVGCLTVPVVVYALSCHIMWVCVYALVILCVTVFLSALVIRELHRRQRQLSADVAHELRTPLSCLQGTLEAMLDGVWPADKARLESCREETLRLARLVSDLSLLADLEWEHITLNKTDFDLSKLIETTAGYFQPEAERKGIALALETESQIVHADYNRAAQVLINITANALKYTDQGTITLGNRGKEVFVADTGAGIERAALPHIFERFYRTDASRSRGTGGSGVGLAIAAALMKAQGGGIRVTSEPGKGSVFRIGF